MTNFDSIQGRCLNEHQVFITKSNFESIACLLKGSLTSSCLDEIFRIEALSLIFSKPEISFLQALQEAYKDPANVFQHYIKQRVKTDTKTWVYEGGAPAYHADENCTRLNANFINLQIPPEIKNRGDKEIENFRRFVKHNRSLLETNERRFFSRLEAQFFLKNSPTRFLSDNSGIEKFTNYQLDEVKAAVDSLLVEADKFRNRDEETKKLIANNTYGTHRVKEAKLEGHPLHIWHNKYKLGLKHLMQEYFRIKFNPELKFEGSLLEQLGFRRCSACCS